MNMKKYLSTIFDGMAKGLFASLIVGVIIKQIGIVLNIPYIINMGQIAQYFMGPCIGIGIAYSREVKQFTLISASIAGAIGAGTIVYSANLESFTVAIGEPVGALITVLVAIEVGKLIEGKTKFDLLIIPAIVILIGIIIGSTISPIISMLMVKIGEFINKITYIQPIPMGILLGIIVGMILTLPISSAALCISIGINGLAAGAALAGCCAQMIGFAVISYRENKISGLFSQGIGTSMLQVPNIIKNPLIWIPPTVASGVVGLLSTTVFKMETNSVGAGMGTSGLVGQFTTLEVMGFNSRTIISILLLHFIIPAVISFIISEIMRKKGLIKTEDLKLG